MTKQGVSPLHFLTRLTALSKENKKKPTITFQNYLLEDIQQKYCLKLYKCKSVIELIFVPPVSECGCRRSAGSATPLLSDEIPVCTLGLGMGF